jgi:superfamily II DNA or RNA helicase
VSYAEFLARKQARVEKPGREAAASDIHPMLHDWQNELVRWAVRTGRAALWADTGMGKTVMQLEWARLSGDRPLVVAPLAVCQQTVREEHQASQITRELVAQMRRVRESA